MKWRYLFIATFFTAAMACNNEASVQDETDSLRPSQDSNQSIYPEPDDVLGNDTIPAREQSKNPTLQKK